MTKEKQTRTWREINLNAIEHNITEVRKKVNEHTMIMGVVKADAYGHGAVEVSKAMLNAGVSRLAVAEVNEAEVLRKAGIDVPVLILCPDNYVNIPKVIDLLVTPSVIDMEYARLLSDAAKKAGKTVNIHIKLDTGMTRVGFNTTDESLNTILEIANLPNIVIEGIFTHFACADVLDRSITDKQFEKYINFVNKLESKGLKIPIKHVANSATIMRFPEYHLDMVRSGIISYGYSPLEEGIPCDIDLIPAMTVKSKITRINNVPKEISISYGHTYTTEKDETKIATVPIGYADGYLRSLSGKVHMSLGGKPVPVVGRICMDQCMIDVTSVNNSNVGDEVIIFGDGRNSVITADTIAELSGTISYEIVCMLSNRVPFIFIKDGEIW